MTRTVATKKLRKKKPRTNMKQDFSPADGRNRGASL
ncbi:hypothetical protein CCACVL1_23518 [Corchorus capsularis]|uniref:Uncharacterized protein n=1 Tax=Corchorus capsularis TaxID=210143 RepID=A0A1R3GTM9_COCAP|nr:hypothetical protein CCACVL1_23518 [Corchorus capsularis]